MHSHWILKRLVSLGFKELMEPRMSEWIVRLLKCILVYECMWTDDASLFSYPQVKDTFNENFHKFHQEWKSTRYEWLPTTEQISKSLGEPIPIQQLQNLEVRETNK
jgi:hypothetical protein